MEITSAEQAYTALNGLAGADTEEFWVMALGPTKNLLNKKMLFRGTVDSCLVHPRDVFRFACVENASSLLVAHNHPSGDPLPSLEDLRFTRQLVKAAAMMDIPIVDHLIVTKSGFSSLKADGWCGFSPAKN